MNKSDFENFYRPLVAENIIFLDEVGSTNDYLKELAKTGEKAGTALIAARQSAGRGRLGRDWDGGEALDIYLSILLKPQMANPSGITLMASVCVTKMLNELLDGHEAKALIKWPNDVIVKGRKICGILSEGGSYGVVLGVGINIFRRSFPKELEEKATSLNLITKRKYERADIIKGLLTIFGEYYEIFQVGGIISFLEEYRALSANIGKEVAVHEKNASYKAVATGIDGDGKLEVLLSDGTQKSLDSGEVSVRGIYGYV